MADGTAAPRSRQAPIRIGAVVALAVAIAFVVWLVVRGDDNSSTAKTSTVRSQPTRTTPPPRETVKAASLASLRALARASGHPIYWAGPQAKVKYELTQVTDGRIYIRYLPKSVAYLPAPAEMLADLRAAGFGDALHLPLSGGITQLLLGTRS